MDTHNTPVTLAIAGHLSLDDVVLPDGSTNFGSLGGATLYASAGALMWGKDTVGLVTRRGYDYDLEAIQGLQKYGLDINGLYTMDDIPNIHIYALYDKNSNRYFVFQKESGNIYNMAPVADEVPKRYVKQAKGFHLAPMPVENVIDILEIIPDDTVITMDPQQEEYFPEYEDSWNKALSRVTAFLPSEDELLNYYKIDKANNLIDYIPYIKRLADKGPLVVALKVGARGVLVYDKQLDMAWTIPAYDSKVVDVTGCGDAFCGGFLADYTRDRDSFEAAIKGGIASSITIERYGVVGNFEYSRQDVLNRYLEYSASIDKEKTRIY